MRAAIARALARTGRRGGAGPEDALLWRPSPAAPPPGGARDAARVRLYLPYISPISPRYLPCISPISPLHLPYISPTSPIYLPYISPNQVREALCALPALLVDADAWLDSWTAARET